MDNSPPCLPSEDSCNVLVGVTANEESAYATSVPGISRLMIDLPQCPDGTDDEASGNSCEADFKLKTGTTEAKCACEHAEEVAPRKRKGGWPKGKKRKLVVDASPVPKAPTTGYVLFINERRKIYKANYPDLAFTEVTKLMGSEWTNLCPKEKQVYLDKASADKKRYKEELRTYRKAKLEHGVENPLPEPVSSLPGDREAATHFENPKDSEDLYCEVCDQFFMSLHNKKEHFYGKQHLQAVTCAAAELGNSSLNSSLHCQPLSVDQSMLDFIEIAIGREAEIKELSELLVRSKDSNASLLRELGQIRALNSKLQGGMQRLKAEEACLKEQLHNLRMVPTLFGMIHFQH